MRNEKDRLRRAQRARRRARKPSYWHRVGDEITRQVKRFLVHRSDLTVGVYHALPDEPVIGPLPHKTAFPLVTGETLSFHQCTREQLNLGAYGISEPPPEAEAVVPEVLIVPGLAFGEDGSRLGRGKGFYDRYLATHDTLSIGVVDEAGVLPRLPCEAHDIPVDVVITQDRVLQRKDERL